MTEGELTEEVETKGDVNFNELEALFSILFWFSVCPSFFEFVIFESIFDLKDILLGALPFELPLPLLLLLPTIEFWFILEEEEEEEEGRGGRGVDIK